MSPISKSISTFTDTLNSKLPGISTTIDAIRNNTQEISEKLDPPRVKLRFDTAIVSDLTYRSEQRFDDSETAYFDTNAVGPISFYIIIEPNPAFDASIHDIVLSLPFGSSQVFSLQTGYFYVDPSSDKPVFDMKSVEIQEQGSANFADITLAPNQGHTSVILLECSRADLEKLIANNDGDIELTYILRNRGSGSQRIMTGELHISR